MQPRPYLSALRRRWTYVIALAVLGAVIAGGYVRSLPDEYVSAGTIDVVANGPRADQYAATMLAKQRVNTYAAIAGGQSAAERAIAESRLQGVTPADVRRMIEASPVPNTTLLRVTARDEDPEKAQQVAAAILRLMPTVISEIELPTTGSTPRLRASVESEASTPTSPVPHHSRAIVALGLAIGALLGAAGAVARDRSDPRVLTAVEVGSRGPRVLGLLPRRPLVGARSASDDTHPSARDEALHTLGSVTLRSRLTSSPGQGGPNDGARSTPTIVVAGVSSPQRAAALSVDLAQEMARTGARVLLVDLAGPRGAAKVLAPDAPVGGLRAALTQDVPVTEAARPHPTGVDLLGGQVASREVSDLVQSPAMTSLLTQARDTYDAVVLLTAPATASVDACYLSAQTDGLVLLVELERTKLRHLDSAVEQADWFGGTVIGLVVESRPRVL